MRSRGSHAGSWHLPINPTTGDTLNPSEPSSEQSSSEPSESSDSSQSESSYISSASSSSASSKTSDVKSSSTSKPESKPPASSSSEVSKVSYPVNINTATQEEFMTLPGISEEQARLFVVWREKAGSYENTLDLVKVKGMSQEQYNRIKDYICL